MCHNCLGHADRHDVDRRQAPVTDAPAAPVATGKPLQDASNLPDLSHQQTAEVARKARRAQHKRDVRAALNSRLKLSGQQMHALTRRAGLSGTRYLQQQQAVLHCQ